jgi:hypothetical protein
MFGEEGTIWGARISETAGTTGRAFPPETPSHEPLLTHHNAAREPLDPLQAHAELAVTVFVGVRIWAGIRCQVSKLFPTCNVRVKFADIS